MHFCLFSLVNLFYTAIVVLKTANLGSCTAALRIFLEMLIHINSFISHSAAQKYFGLIFVPLINSKTKTL